MPYTSIATTVESAAGVARVQYALLDPNGIPNGPSALLANGQDSGFGVHIAAKRANASTPAPRTVDVTGDNGRFRHKYVFLPATLGELDLAFGAFNDSAYAVFTQTKLDTSNGEWVIVGGEVSKPANANSICLIENIDAQDGNAGTDGQARFINWVYLVVNVYPLFSPHDEAAAAEWAFKGILTRAARYPWGTAFSNATNGFVTATRVKVSSVYPITMHTFIGDGSKSSFILNYTPASDQTGFAIKAWNATTGVPVTISSVVVGNKQVTLSSIPVAGTPIVVLYEAIDLLN